MTRTAAHATLPGLLVAVAMACGAAGDAPLAPGGELLLVQWPAPRGPDFWSVIGYTATATADDRTSGMCRVSRTPPEPDGGYCEPLSYACTITGLTCEVDPILRTTEALG